MTRLLRHQSLSAVLRVHSLGLIAVMAAWMFASASDGSAAAQTLTGPNVRVSTHDFFPADPFVSPTGARSSTTTQAEVPSALARSSNAFTAMRSGGRAALRS